MVTARHCAECGAELPAGSLRQKCPRCLLQIGLDIAHPLPLERARRFGDYELLEEIARGGMGIVYKARQVSLDRTVAVKMMLFGESADSKTIQRFRQEAQAAAKLQHRNIVAVHEVGEHEGQQYFTMDYFEGPSLALLVGHTPWPGKRAAQLVRTLAEAIQYAHEHGVLHRDLKPSNVLVDASEQPCITDFGLAKVLESKGEMTLTGQVLGTPAYSPPEQAAGKREQIGPASDVYGLGAILYFCLTGRAPFVADSLETILEQVLHHSVVSPRLLNASVPHDLETICLKCLEKEPARRYSSARLLAEELGRFLRDELILARPVNRLQKAWRWCRRSPRQAILAGALVLAVALGLMGVLWEWRAAEHARRVAEGARAALTERLWDSYLAQARAQRWSGRAGRRFTALEALRKAAAIRPTVELRNEAIACMSLADARVQSRIPEFPHLRTGGSGFALNGEWDLYAEADMDASISIRRLKDHVEVNKLPARGPVQVCDLVFSPRGRFLAQNSGYQTSVPFALWNLESGRLMFSAPFPVRSLCFTPDERQLILAEAAGRLHFWELATGEQVGQMTVAPGVNHLALDPQGRRLAMSRREGPSVVVIDVKSGAAEATLTNAGEVGFMAWSPDGVLLACPSGEQVLLWNVASGERKALQGHYGVATAAHFNHLGDVVVSSGWDGVTWFWDPKLAQPLVSLPGGWLHNGFAGEDRRLAFGLTGYGWGIWEVEPARECRRLGRTAAVWDAQFTGDGGVLATASSDGIRLWHVGLNRQLAHLPLAEARSVAWMQHSGAAPQSLLLASTPTGIQAWSVEISLDATHVSVGPARHLSEYGRDQGRLAGRYYITAASVPEADVAVIDTETAGPARLLKGHPNTALVSVSPTGRLFATGTWKGSEVKIWSTETWEPIKVLPVNGSAACLFSPGGEWLVTGSSEEYCFWRSDLWERGPAIARDRAGDMYGSMALAPDGRILALLHGRNSGVKLVSFPEGKELAHLDTGRPLCFSPDGTQLVTAGEDARSLFVWDLVAIRRALRGMNLDWD